MNAPSGLLLGGMKVFPSIEASSLPGPNPGHVMSSIALLTYKPSATSTMVHK